jgi:hypothetical protein
MCRLLGAALLRECSETNARYSASFFLSSPGIKARMRRRAAPDLPPGGRVCNGCQQNFGGRG